MEYNKMKMLFVNWYFEFKLQALDESLSSSHCVAKQAIIKLQTEWSKLYICVYLSAIVGNYC